MVTPLSDAELAIVPDLVRSRLCGSIVWRAGRERRGQSTWTPVMTQLADAQECEAQLDAYRRV